MDVQDFLALNDLGDGRPVALTGWLVDFDDGLYLLGHHWPEDYSFQIRVKIANGNIMYPVLRAAPSLGGGRSKLFYRARVIGRIVGGAPHAIEADQLFVEARRESGVYDEIDIRPQVVAESVKARGDFDFGYPRDPTRDWLES